MTYPLFFLGFFALVKGASLLVDGAASIARRFNVSDFAIGMTVVAFGTSTPELFVTLIAALGGSPDIAVGNVVGSNIASTAQRVKGMDELSPARGRSLARALALVAAGLAGLALGNVLGSNIFNIYFVLGVTATVRPLPIHAENTVDLIAMVGANLLLFAAIVLGRRLVLARWEGSVLVTSYLAYLVAGIARMQ